MTNRTDQKEPAQAGSFELFERIGRGGMGEVFRAVHLPTNSPAAVKVITAARAKSPSAGSALHREVQATAMLTHPCIIEIYDFGTVTADEEARAAGTLTAHSPYLAIELAQHGSLSDIIASETLGWFDIKAILLSLLDALAHAHARKIIHRDIKPENILCFEADGRRIWKLTDFGIAHSLAELDAPPTSEQNAEKSDMSGTPNYMAPEQFTGTRRQLVPATDLYAFGCLAYQLVSGELPFEGPSPVHLGIKHVSSEPAPLAPTVPVPDGFDRWVATLMAKHPRDRYEKAADAAWALLRLGDPASDMLSQPAPASDNHTAPTVVDMPMPTQIIGTTLGLDVANSSMVEQIDAESADSKRDAATAQTAPMPRSWRSLDAADQSQASLSQARLSQTRLSQTRLSQTRLSQTSVNLYGLREIPLVGREDERDQLWADLLRTRRERLSQDDRHSQNKRPRCAVLAGPSGCGKSRLARWLSERADELGAATPLEARHTREGGFNDGLRAMLTRHFRCAGLSGDALSDHLEPWVERLPADAQWLGPALVDWLGTHDDNTSDDARTDDKPAQRFRLVAQTLRHLAANRALVVWLDDLQWGESTLDFVEFVFQSGSLDGVPVFFCATVQLEALGERPALGERLDQLVDQQVDEDGSDESQDNPVHRLELDALSHEDTERLIETLLRVDDALMQRIARRVDGNPLFAVQLIGDWVERGWLVPDERGPDERGLRLVDGVEPELPDNLHQTWAERIDRLLAGSQLAGRQPAGQQADGRRALQLAALLGRDVDTGEWELACTEAGVGTEGLQTFVDTLVDQRLARRDEQHDWSFIHGMLRESLVRRTRESDHGSALHAACARALEALRRAGASGSRADNLAGRVGRHRFHAHDFDAALEPLAQGIQRGIERGEYLAALELVDLRDRAVEEMGPGPSRDGLENDLSRTRIASSLHHMEEADTLAERVHTRAEANGWRALAAEALLVRCNTKHAAGDLRAAGDYGEQALTIYQALEDPAGLVEAHLRLGDNCAYLGKNADALDHYQQALEPARRLGNTSRVAWSHYGRGYILQQQGQLDRAHQALEQASQLYQQLGWRAEQANVLISLGDVARMQSRFDDAQTAYLDAYQFYRTRHLVAPTIDFNLALLAITRADLDRARTWTARAAQSLQRTPRTHVRFAVEHLHLVLTAHDRDLDAFDHHLDTFDHLLAATGLVDADLADLLERAAAELPASDAERRRRTLTAARDMWEALERAEDAERLEKALGEL